MGTTGWPAASLFGAAGTAPIMLVCEHASRFIPPQYDGLGLDDDAKHSHAAWDIGALEVAKCLSVLLDAPLVAGEVSRLVYDCNRPLEAPDSIPVRSEVIDIPGNSDLTDAAKRARFDSVHKPFHDLLDHTLDQQIAKSPTPVLLVTIHSFTPVFHGKRRSLDLGFLHDKRADIANAAAQHEKDRGTFRTAVNEPYAARDGVTYTLAKHAETRGLDSVMIEIRNDLIATPLTAEAMATHLAGTLRHLIRHTNTLENVET